MHKYLYFTLVLASLASPLVRADEAAEASPLSATVTLGYDSRYVLYGYRLSRHLWHADVYLSKPVGENTTVWGGAWYGYLTDGTYNELDLYAGVDYAVNDVLTIGLAYSLFNYIEVPYETSENVSEFAAHVTAATGPFSLQVRNQYDTEAEGNLLRVIAGYYQSLGDRTALNLSAEYGYAFEYFIDGNQPNHALFRLELPVTVSDAVSVTPFIARSMPLAAIEEFEEYETYGGASVSWSF